MKIAVEKADALEYLAAYMPESVDLFLTDLPYESLEKHRKVGGTTGRLKHSKMSSNDWFEVFPNYKLPHLFHLAYRILRKNRHAYVFCDDETSDIMKRCAVEAGFKVWKRLVWDKTVIGMGYHYRCQYEFILFLEKGKRKLNSNSIPDVIQCKPIRNGYPTEKPVELLSTLIRQSTTAGEVVCDPFCGSGATGVAAVEHGCGFIGADIEQKAIDISQARLMKARGMFR